MTTPDRAAARRLKELAEQKPQQRVVCSAIRIDVDRMICSPRHCDTTFRAIVNLLPPADQDEWYQGEQGFVDQFGKFLSRQESWVVAEKAGQILHRCGGDGVKLYSENLY